MLFYSFSTLLLGSVLVFKSAIDSALCMPTAVTRNSMFQLSRRSVYNPKITYPDAGAKLKTGSRVMVTWDTSDMPHDTTNSKGKVVLGYLDGQSDSEHLDLAHPLADGFEISACRVEVTVPMVDHRKDYIVVLFGDSGNRSPTFTIN